MDSFVINTNGIEIPHVDQYFGMWAINPHVFEQTVANLQAFDLQTHMARRSEHRVARSSGERAGEIAIVEMSGPLMKHASSFTGGTSTVMVRQTLRSLMADDDVGGVLLVIDSPGGTVSGTQELADDISRLAATKPTHAFVDDMAASAAYWAASQTNKITVNRTGMSGGIGTYATVIDSSKYADQLGIKVHVIKSGQFKGAGVPGTEITDEQLGEAQRIVDELNEHFLTGVARGRGLAMDQVRKIADGRVHVGATAVDLRLVDAVGSIDDAIEGLRNEIEETGSQKTMAETTQDTTAAATPAELRAACPGASNDFLIEMVELGATKSEAMEQFITAQNKNLEAATERANKLETATTAHKPAAVDPLGDVGSDSSTGDDGEPLSSDWESTVAAVLKRPGVKTRADAAMIANRENPGMRKAFVNEYNKPFGRPAL